MTDGMDVINAIDPDAVNLANMLDLLTDLTLDLGGDGTGRGPTDRVHALATACATSANEIVTELEKMARSASGEPAPDIPDDQIAMAYRLAKPAAKVAVMSLLRSLDEADRRAKLATIRAECAEQSLRNITQELDRTHREIDRVKQAGQAAA